MQNSLRRSGARDLPDPTESLLDRKFASGDRKLWNVMDPGAYSADPIVRRMMEKLPPEASVFEFGAGRGRNALPMAEAGFRVVAQDVWGTALEDLASRAAESGTSVEIRKCDAGKLSLEEGYDALVCIRTLHFLNARWAANVLAQMRKAAKPGGFNAHSLFVEPTEHGPSSYFPEIEAFLREYLEEGWTIEAESEIHASKPGESTNGKTFYQKSVLLRKPEGSENPTDSSENLRGRDSDPSERNSASVARRTGDSVRAALSREPDSDIGTISDSS